VGLKVAKYNFFQGGPAATDLSGLFAQIDTGAIARGVASASQSIGNAITERYAQTQEENKAAKLTDGIVKSDLGEMVLKFHKIPGMEDYNKLNNSQKARLIPSFQTGMALGKLASDDRTARQERNSQKALGDAMSILNEPLLNKNPEENLRELVDKFDFIQGYDYTDDHRKQITDHFNTLYDRVEKGLDLEFGEVSDAAPGLIPWRAGGGRWTIANLPAEKVPTTTNLGKLIAEHSSAVSTLNAAKGRGAGEQKIKELEAGVSLYKKAMEKEVAGSHDDWSLQFDPESGNLLNITRGRSADLTIGTKGKHQYALSKFKSAIDGLEDVVSLYDDEYVGVMGFFGEHIVDRGIGSLPFDWAQDMTNKDRIRFRNKVKQWNATIMRIAGDENRFSNEDRAAILDGIVNLKASDAPDRAVIAMQNMRESLIGRAIVHSRELAKVGENVDLTWLPSTAVIREYRNANLLEGEARKILDSHFENGSEILDMREPEDVANKLKGKIPNTELAKILKALYPED